MLSRNGSILHVQGNHLISYFPKKPLLYPHLRKFMRFSDSTHYDIPKSIKYANNDSSPFSCDESVSDKNSSQNDPFCP